MSSPIRSTEFRCEYRTRPLDIATQEPRLGWQLDAGDARGVVQSAYQILAAASPEALAADYGNLWDSG